MAIAANLIVKKKNSFLTHKFFFVCISSQIQRTNNTEKEQQMLYVRVYVENYLVNSLSKFRCQKCCPHLAR